MIVAGFGARASATTTALHAVLRLAAQGCPPLAALAAPEDRATLLTELADLLNLPIIALRPQVLSAIVTPTRSAISLHHRGTGSVAEACALAAAGPGARLLALRHLAPDRTATCALAQGISS